METKFTNAKIKRFLKELRLHLPLTIFSIAMGLIFLALLSVLLQGRDFPQSAQKLYHVFHPLHLLFSTTTTTAMFWRYERRLLKAIIIGFLGAECICGISDILIPFIAGTLLKVKMEFHVCLITHPGFILPFLFFGIFTGLLVPTVVQSTMFSHAVHVVISSMASIFYLVSYGLTEWISVAGAIFIYMILAVVIPCCTSDIVFPLLLVRENLNKEIL